MRNVDAPPFPSTLNPASPLEEGLNAAEATAVVVSHPYDYLICFRGLLMRLTQNYNAE